MSFLVDELMSLWVSEFAGLLADELKSLWVVS